MEVDPGGFKEEAVPLIMEKELSFGKSRSNTENMGPLTQMSSEQKTNEKLRMIIGDQARQIRELMQAIKDHTAKIDSLTAQAIAVDAQGMEQITQGIGQATSSMAMIPMSLIGSAMGAMKAIGDVAVGIAGQAASMFGSAVNPGGMSNSEVEEVEATK
ncbi:unnamed protein product [Acanthoscelides obtectus]|uniref:Uncharacterized protein n=1 Tax=Acanthoscelides obtectus TaxID=200917 RepID=A0A9P0NXP6_ACAOB|nr:unnamed protein product [Acanthoscelides obtectus]CAK1647969.1 hypothetical protein AOBTE_LOCUS15480 [Acanthoscelides obtectus]